MYNDDDDVDDTDDVDDVDDAGGDDDDNDNDDIEDVEDADEQVLHVQYGTARKGMQMRKQNLTAFAHDDRSMRSSVRFKYAQQSALHVHFENMSSIGTNTTRRVGVPMYDTNPPYS